MQDPNYPWRPTRMCKENCIAHANALYCWLKCVINIYILHKLTTHSEKNINYTATQPHKIYILNWNSLWWFEIKKKRTTYWIHSTTNNWRKSPLKFNTSTFAFIIWTYNLHMCIIYWWHTILLHLIFA